MEGKILVINGPNLNLLGVREPEIYGAVTLDKIREELESIARSHGVEMDFYQSNHEGDLVDRIQASRDHCVFMIVNAGALTHYSIALYDALKAVNIPFIEVHLSNIYAREPFRSHSLLSPIARGGVYGLGALSYRLALEAALDSLQKE